MQFFSNLKRWRLERHFKRNGLCIIQQIPTELFHSIIETLAKRGWEVTLDYRGPKGWSEKGQCKLRKGTSVLEFSWSNNALGSIIGIERIVSGIAKDFDLIQFDKPQ